MLHCDIVSHQMTTPEDIRHEIAGSTRYSEFDMNHGYNQSTLSEESSKKYGVFQTHEGFHRFTGLYFGHKQSSQAFDADRVHNNVTFFSYFVVPLLNLGLHFCF